MLRPVFCSYVVIEVTRTPNSWKISNFDFLVASDQKTVKTDIHGSLLDLHSQA